MTTEFGTDDSGAGPQRDKMPTMIVFCHLRWGVVFRRPQQLLTRLAEHYRILFVEEPVFHDGDSFLRSYGGAPNLTVLQPHTPVHAAGFHDDQIPVLQPLLADLVAPGEDLVVWFYTPMALPLLQGLQPTRIVYDCMDELSAFRNAPRQLLQRENALLNIADLVFTGGPSLYEAKRHRHHNAHCFASSVDVAHFSKALERHRAHPSQAGLPSPRLGFYGVIDERFDVDLLRALADAHPDWQLTMVGPIVKIDQAALPRNPNIHYMGQASYDELPQYLAAWDVCLLPFASNESTRSINPTKVLEYMAAELPIVSTAIADIVGPYGGIVSIGDSHAQFIAACEEALDLAHERRTIQIEAMREVVRCSSWAATVQCMHGLISAPRKSRSDKEGRKAPAGKGARINPLRSGPIVITGVKAAAGLAAASLTTRRARGE